MFSAKKKLSPIANGVEARIDRDRAARWSAGSSRLEELRARHLGVRRRASPRAFATRSALIRSTASFQGLIDPGRIGSCCHHASAERDREREHAPEDALAQLLEVLPEGHARVLESVVGPEPSWQEGGRGF